MRQEQEQVAALFVRVAMNMQAVAKSPYVEAVGRVVDLLVDTFVAGRKLLVFGNGGSAADAQHFTAEFVGRFVAERRPLPAIALATNEAILTAWSNDYSFEDVFARQVEALGQPGDVAFGMTTSGTSPNVVHALTRARERGLRTVALTSVRGAGLAGICDVLLAAPISETARIQEVHLVTCHAICGEVERRLLGSAAPEASVPSAQAARALERRVAKGKGATEA